MGILYFEALSTAALTNSANNLRLYGRAGSLPQGWLDDPEELVSVDGRDSGSGG